MPRKRRERRESRARRGDRRGEPSGVAVWRTQLKNLARLSAISAISAASAAVVLAPQNATAQQIDRFTADSVIAIDTFGGENVSGRPQMVVDVSAGVRLGANWQVYFRPWFRKARPSTPTAAAPPWDAQLYQAGLRYERPGNVAVRVDAGQLVSPVGLGMMDWRPNLNPTIVPHLSNVVPMPVFDPTVPRQVPIAQAYPLGTQVTLSNTIWDARTAVVNSAPTHAWAVGADNNPGPTPVLEAGGGITPIVGLRFGLSLAHGKYVTKEDAPRTPDGRSMTLIGGEAEYAFRYTKLSGEFERTQFETSTGTAIASEYFVQGVQTISARWFGAGRYEGASAPPLAVGPVVGRRTQLRMLEGTAGFRVTPAITIRSSYYARHSYTSAQWDRQVGVSLVWTQRWR